MTADGLTIFAYAELTTDRVRYWLALDGWTPEEAAHLLCGVAPFPHLLKQWSLTPAFEAWTASRYEADHKARLTMLLRAGEAGALLFPVAPQTLIQWAMSKDMRLPAPLIPAGCIVKGGKWVCVAPNDTRPRFTMPVWPKEVPPELLALPRDTLVVGIEAPRAGHMGRRECSAWQLAQAFTDLMSRQAQGKFLLNEAAQILADANNVDAEDWLERMEQAATAQNAAARLCVYGFGSGLPRQPSESLLAHDYTTTAKLADWLQRTDADVRFPLPEQPQHSTDGARPEPGKPASIEGCIHTTRRRANILGAAIVQAQRNALDATDWTSAWAALVGMASSNDRPAPLLGYSEGEGVKYQTDRDTAPVAFLTREAFRKRISRLNAATRGR